MHCDVAIEIDAPAPEVWAVLADVTRWPEWTPTMNEVRLRDGGRLGSASVAEIRQPRLPKAIWTVIEFEDGHRFAWTASGPGVRTGRRPPRRTAGGKPLPGHRRHRDLRSTGPAVLAARRGPDPALRVARSDEPEAPLRAHQLLTTRCEDASSVELALAPEHGVG
ncbi:MAG: SRPBCC family protein [Pseudonocardia sp.]